ncbi:hypothetical protein KCP77_19670 [Salmonella enterica subsp. enterica]|nr:hypothetical protein KCP77_19670 [Salmonella enterica subsp. enterica]
MRMFGHSPQNRASHLHRQLWRKSASSPFILAGKFQRSTCCRSGTFPVLAGLFLRQNPCLIPYCFTAGNCRRRPTLEEQTLEEAIEEEANSGGYL